MDIKVVVGFIYNVIECIDMDGIVAFFTFMYKLLSLDEVLGYAYIEAVAGQNVVIEIQVI